MEDLIKDIIINKRYFELNSEEKMLVKEYAENEAEFDAIKLTLEAVSDFDMQLNSRLSPEVKHRLNERFQAKHSVEKSSQWNKLWLFFFPQGTQFYQKPAFQLAAIALIVLITIPFLWKDDTPQYAVNTVNDTLEINKVEFEKTTSKPSITSSDKVEYNTIESSKKVQDVIPPPPPVAIEETNVALEQDDVVIEEQYVIEDYMLSSQSKNSRSAETSNSSLAVDSGVEKAIINYSNKKVETSETLDLLIALY